MKEWEASIEVHNPLDRASLSSEEKLLQRCKERSLYLLTGTAKTERRLKEKLEKSQRYTEDVIAKTIAFLKEYDYLNDYQYALRYLEENGGKRSLRDMKAKLFQRGVDSASLTEAIEVFQEKQREEEGNPEREALLKCLEKKRRSLDLTDPKEKQRLYAFLMRKGFSYDLIRDALSLEEEFYSELNHVYTRNCIKKISQDDEK